MSWNDSELTRAPPGVLPNLRLGRIYKRRQLHERYGGQTMSGISTPTGRKCVLLFTNADANKVTKYCDGWKEDGTFQYSGAGQKGDQHWTKGNLAIRDHKKNRNHLYLFAAVEPTYYKYLGEFECVGYKELATQGRDEKIRTSFEFSLKPCDGASLFPDEQAVYDEPMPIAMEESDSYTHHVYYSTLTQPPDLPQVYRNTTQR